MPTVSVLLGLSVFSSNLALVTLALLELSGFSSNLALVTLQLFGLYGFSSILALVTLGRLTCMFPASDLFG